MAAYLPSSFIGTETSIPQNSNTSPLKKWAAFPFFFFYCLSSGLYLIQRDRNKRVAHFPNRLTVQINELNRQASQLILILPNRIIFYRQFSCIRSFSEFITELSISGRGQRSMNQNGKSLIQNINRFTLSEGQRTSKILPWDAVIHLSFRSYYLSV